MMAMATASEVSTERVHASRYRKHRTPGLTARFFGPGQLVLLLAVVVLIAIMLFPKQLIDQQLDASTHPSNATLAYLELLARAQPGDESLQLQLAGERLRAGQLGHVETGLSPLVRTPDAHTPRLAQLWLQLRRQQYFAAPEGTLQREDARTAYAAALRESVPWLQPQDQIEQIEDARQAGLYDTAAALAEGLLSRTGAQPSSQRTAPSGSSPESSTATPPPAGATRLLLNPNRLVGVVWSPDLDLVPVSQRRPETDATTEVDIHERAFDALVESQLSAGRPEAALRSAQEHIATLDPAHVDWPRMIRLANGANRPAAGESFAQHWLDSASGTASRWAAFQALVDAYLADNQPKQALAAAEAHLAGIPKNAQLWRFMTHLAMQAGDNGKAVYYARRLVGLGGAHAG